MFKNFVMVSVVILSSTQALAQFKGEAEAGAVVVSGNTESESYSLKTKNTYVKEANSYTVAGRYLKAQANGVESARSWEAGARLDRNFSSAFAIYLGHKAESDIFAGYIQRDSTDLGGKYNIVSAEELKWFVELGYRFTKTHLTAAEDQNSNFGRLYTEIQKSISRELSFKYWAEYLPNFTNTEAYLANTEASLNVMLSQVFSLKLSYLLKYQNIGPANGERVDTSYTTSLVANF